MIVVTTPTGQVGEKLVPLLLDKGETVRVIARDGSRLDAGWRDRVEVVEGSHDDPVVLDRALRDVDALFWLVPPSFFRSDTVRTFYRDFTAPVVAAIRDHRVPRVVGVTSAGHGFSGDAGNLSASFETDAEIRSTGTAYRALSMPWYMENLLAQVDAIRAGTLPMPNDPDRVLASVATRDIAAVAAQVLAEVSWTGQDDVLVFGPDRLTPRQMAEVVSQVLDRTVSYVPLALDDFAQFLQGHGASSGVSQDMVAMLRAQNAGIYDDDVARATPQPTDFRSWCEEVLRPAVQR